MDMLVPAEELAERARALEAAGGYPFPPSQTPWQAIFRREVTPFSKGMGLRDGPAFQDIAAKGLLRANH